MTPSPSPVVGPPAHVHVRLAHACTQWIADSVDVRALHFKGQAVDQEMRTLRGGGSDVDLIVQPAGLRRFQDALTDHGWELYTSFHSGSVFGHAATYYHPTWGTADLHRWVPGIDGAPAFVFDQLWVSRETREIGGVECNVPSDDHHRLLLLLHAARNAVVSDPDFVLGWGSVELEQRRRIRQAAYLMGGHVPFNLVTTDVTFVPGRHARLWATIVAGGGTTEQWVARFKDVASVQDFVSLVGEAVRANQDHLRLKLGHMPSRTDLVEEQVRRAGAAMQWVAYKVTGR